MFYIGSTNNLSRRLKEHFSGKVFSTKNRLPIELYAYQECASLIEARVLEHKYKKSHDRIKRAIKNGSLKIVGD